MWQIPFLTEYEYQILFGFQKSPNTEYQILFGIEKILIPNTKYYSVLRKLEYWIWIILFGLNIGIPNTKYRIVYKLLGKKRQLKSTNLSHTRHFVLKFCETIRTDIWTCIKIPKYYLGCQKKLIPNIKYYLLSR